MRKNNFSFFINTKWDILFSVGENARCFSRNIKCFEFYILRKQAVALKETLLLSGEIGLEIGGLEIALA